MFFPFSLWDILCACKKISSRFRRKYKNKMRSKSWFNSSSGQYIYVNSWAYYVTVLPCCCQKTTWSAWIDSRYFWKYGSETMHIVFTQVAVVSTALGNGLWLTWSGWTFTFPYSHTYSVQILLAVQDHSHSCFCFL